MFRTRTHSVGAARAGSLAVLLLTIVLGATAVPATAQNVLAGSNALMTPPTPSNPAGTHIDFGSNPLPADFFGPGSLPFEGLINMGGVPLQGSQGSGGAPLPPGTDTIIERLQDAILPDPFNSQDTVDIEIVALSLQSSQPIQVEFSGGETSLYDLYVCLADDPQPPGQMTIFKTCPEGGSYNATVPVLPRFAFTRIAGIAGDPIIDLNPGPVFNLIITDACWAHNDPGFGLYPLDFGQVDHNCDGLADQFFPPSSNFYPGVCVLPCNSDDPVADFRTRVTVAAGDGARHMFIPAVDPDGDDDGDFVHNAADNCPGDFNPLQEDADNDTVGDACDNCPNDYNPFQEDGDGNGIGDACELVEGIQFYQVNFDLDGVLTPDSEWGAVELTYLGDPNILYFNLQVDGNWVVENIPVLSQAGVGALQQKVYHFDLGVPRGTDLNALTYDWALTPDALFGPPPGIIGATVGERNYCLFSGVRDFIIPPLPFSPATLLGHILFGPAHENTNFPNQECGTNECTPASVSNSLKFLNDKHNLGMNDGDLSIAKMKTATNWDSDGCWIDPDPNRPAGQRNAWWQDKAQYMVDNDLPITTRKITNLADLGAELDDDQDVELQGDWHTAAIVGITQLADGRFAIDVAHDTKQNQAGGTEVHTITYDPANPGDGFQGSPGFFQGSSFRYAVVECPTPQPPAWYGNEDGLTVTQEHELDDGTWPPTEDSGKTLPGWSTGSDWDFTGDLVYVTGRGVGITGENKSATITQTVDNSYYPAHVKRVWIQFDVYNTTTTGSITWALTTSAGSVVENQTEDVRDRGQDWRIVTITADINPQPENETFTWTMSTGAGGGTIALRNLKFGTHCEPPEPEHTLGLGWNFPDPILPPLPDFPSLPPWYEGDTWTVTPEVIWIGDVSGFAGVWGIPSGAPGTGQIEVVVDNRFDAERIKLVYFEYDYYAPPGTEFSTEIVPSLGSTVQNVDGFGIDLGNGWRKDIVTLEIHPQPAFETLFFYFSTDGSNAVAVDNIKLETFCVLAGPLPCPGDANCDGQVDFGDINAFVAALVDGVYCDGTGANADVDGNGSVGFEDINPFVALLTQNPLPIPCP